jgi:hypothetical protein
MQVNASATFGTAQQPVKSLGRPFRNESSKDMAFPHPKSRKDEYWNEHKPDSGGVVRDFFKRTVHITGYRNGKDDVNPAKHRTFGGIFHDWCVPLDSEF